MSYLVHALEQVVDELLTIAPIAATGLAEAVALVDEPTLRRAPRLAKRDLGFRV